MLPWILPFLIGAIVGLVASAVFFRYFASERDAIPFDKFTGELSSPVSSEGHKPASLKDKIYFTPDSGNVCHYHFEGLVVDEHKGCTRKKCDYLHGRPGEPSSCQLEVLQALLTAKKQIDVCVFRISNTRFSKALTYLKSKKVNVRVICDNGQDDKDHQSEIKKLKEGGVQVKLVAREEAFMHNKFAIVDKRLLVFGSANWTWNGFMKNDEAIEISKQQDKIRLFAKRFDLLWAEK